MRAIAIAALVLAFVSVAQADDLLVVEASIEADGARVGDVRGMHAQIASVDGDRLTLGHTGAQIEMTVVVDLAAEGTYVQVGYAAETELDNDSGFTIRARQGSWVPLFRVLPNEYQVGLPADFPATVARSSRSLPLPVDRPTSTPFSFDGTDPEVGLLERCEGDQLQPSASSRVRWTIPLDAWVYDAGPIRRGFRPVRVLRHGFVVEGVMRVRQCDDIGGMGMGSMGVASGDGWTTGRVVTLPSGTELYASATSTAPFAVLRDDAIGLEPIHDVVRKECHTVGRGRAARDVCARVPAEPTGIASWIVPIEGDLRALLEVVVREPAESLADVDPARRNHGRGFGLSSSVVEWPARPATP